MSKFRRAYRHTSDLVDVLERLIEAVDMSDTTDDVAVRVMVEEARAAIAAAKGGA